jgi:PGF-CTERM protein
MNIVLWKGGKDMKRNRSVLLVLICILIVISTPLCVAIEEEGVNPTVDLEIGVRDDDDVSKVGIDFIINNPSQKEVSLTSFKYSVYINGEWEGSEHLQEGLEWLGVGFGLPVQSLQPLGTVTIKRNFSITMGEPLEQFLRKGFSNITVNGSLSINIDNNSFEVPFEKTTTVYLEIDEKEAKRAICPNITGIELKTSTLESPGGEITDVFINQSIIITNPNPTTICLDTLDYKVYFNKDGKWVRLFSGFAGGGTIESMGSYRKSIEHRESDDEVIQYLMRGSPTDIRVRGSMFMHPREKGWSPTYFESPFETVITTINGSGVWGEVTPAPPPSPTAPILSPTPSPIPGFEALFAIAGLLAVAYLVRRRK